jgi:type II secretory pathway component PulF
MMAVLDSMRLLPRSLPWRSESWARWRFRRNHRQRLGLWRSFANLLRGRDPVAVCELIRRANAEGRNPTIAAAMTAWRDALRNGKSLELAIIGWCPEAERMLIAAGARTASLPAMITRMAIAREKLNRIRLKTRAGLIQPAILTVIAWATVIGYAQFLRDTAESFADGPNAVRLKCIEAFAGFVIDWLSWGVPAALAAIGAALVWAMIRWRGAGRVIAERVWPFNLYKRIQAADFLLALSALRLAGYSDIRALTAIRVFATPYLRWQLDALQPLARDRRWGKALADAKRQFPSDDFNTLAGIFAENDATYPGELQRLTDEWIDELVESMDRQKEAIIGAVMLIVIILTLAASLLIGALLPAQQ